VKLAFSSLAWSSPDDRAVAEILRSNGFTGVELAPTKLWPDLSRVKASDVARCRNFWNDEGLPIVALQAILYGRDDLQLFGAPRSRSDLESFLLSVMDLSASLGAAVVVLGAPGNRKKGDLTPDEANDMAVPVLRRLGESAAAKRVTLCIEPNPAEYGCDWILSAAEGRELVERVGSPGFKLHLDAGTLALSSSNALADIDDSMGVLQHFHVSEPRLVEIGEGGADHPTIAGALEKSGYTGWCSVEMRELTGDPELSGIARAAVFARDVYGLPRGCGAT